MSDAPDADGPVGDVDGADPSDGDGTPLGRDERERLAALADAKSLADLVALTGAPSEHEAYVAAKQEWADLWRRHQDHEEPGTGEPRGRSSTRSEDGEDALLPGETVTVDGVNFHVHGVTHVGTEAERSYLRDRVGRLLDRGAAVYTEQGIRQMHFEDFDVCEMDDYRWALQQCEDLAEPAEPFDEFEPLSSGPLEAASERLRTAVYSLIETYSDVYGETVERTLGDLASTVFTDHEGLATGDEYEPFALRQVVAEDPEQLPALQAYYRRAFLPQPVEREWVRRHDPDLEWVTHARNARMADYAVYHRGDATEVHLIVGAAHGPGVVYYLRQHRDGERDVGGFELV